MAEVKQKAEIEIPTAPPVVARNEPTRPLIEDAKQREKLVKEAHAFIDKSTKEMAETSDRVMEARRFIALNTIGNKQVPLAELVTNFQKASIGEDAPKKKTKAKAVTG